MRRPSRSAPFLRPNFAAWAQRLALLLGLAVACAGAPGVAAAQPDGAKRPGPSAEEMLGQRRLITGFEIEYVKENPGHPAPEDVLQATLEVTNIGDGYAPPIEGQPTVTIRLADVPQLEQQHFYDAALPLIAPAVVEQLQELGLIGVYVEPDPREIGVVDGRIVDRRPQGQTTLTLLVTTGFVTEVRTQALHERVEEFETLNNPVHRRIIERSPIQPYEEGDEVRSDLLDRNKIDEYIFRLNRHPGRRVDVALNASSQTPGGVGLDYLVTENRPWMFYFQLANTGTISGSGLRERFGFMHTQLTNNDDILLIDYLTENFEDSNALLGSYEAPIGDLERWRYRVFGTWYEYTAADVGQTLFDFDGTGYAFGGEVFWNFFQDRELFIDAVAGARWENAEVDDNIFDTRGRESFVLPYAGLRLERETEAATTNALATVEFQVKGVDEEDLNLLGRFDADENWANLLFDASHSQFLEPLFHTGDPNEVTLAHELFVHVRGQHSFGSRLIPNYQQTAGGLHTVRGYPQSEVAGDSAVIGTFEYRYHIPRGFEPQASPGTFLGGPFRWRPQYPAGPVDWDLIAKGFVDVARVWNFDKLSFENDYTLVSVGLGAELVLTRRFRIRVDWGVALNDLEDGTGDNLVDSGDNRWHFELTVIF